MSKFKIPSPHQLWVSNGAHEYKARSREIDYNDTQIQEVIDHVLEQLKRHLTLALTHTHMVNIKVGVNFDPPMSQRTRQIVVSAFKAANYSVRLVDTEFLFTFQIKLQNGDNRAKKTN